MQTFLPFPNYFDCAKVLDAKRLGKQRVEAKQILDILTNHASPGRWKNHPAVLMWKDYEMALAEYGMRMCNEWRMRGFKDNLLPYFTSMNQKLSKKYNKQYMLRRGIGLLPITPWWMQQIDFHLSHQSNLVRKNPDFYRNFFPKVADNLPYLWPNNAFVKKILLTTPSAFPVPGPGGNKIPTAWFHTAKGKTI